MDSKSLRRVMLLRRAEAPSESLIVARAYVRELALVVALEDLIILRYLAFTLMEGQLDRRA